MAGTTPNSLTRRQALIAGSAGAAALVAFANVGQAAEIGQPNEAERKNIALVNAFCATCSEEKPDPVKIAGYMTDDVIWNQGAIAVMKGRAAVIEKFRSILENNARLNLRVIDSFARGDMVAHTRIDTRSVNGGPFTPYAGPIGSVYYIRDGRIAEWHELLVPRA